VAGVSFLILFVFLCPLVRPCGTWTPSCRVRPLREPKAPFRGHIFSPVRSRVEFESTPRYFCAMRVWVGGTAFAHFALKSVRFRLWMSDAVSFMSELPWKRCKFCLFIIRPFQARDCLLTQQHHVVRRKVPSLSFLGSAIIVPLRRPPSATRLRVWPY